MMTPHAWALGLYSYSAPPPGAEVYGKFHEQVLATFQDLGITPTYFAAEGPEYSGDLTPFGDPSQSRLLQEGFTGIHGLTVASNPEGSKAHPEQALVSCAGIGRWQVDAGAEQIAERVVCRTTK